MIENLDENFGRLLETAEGWGLLENTLYDMTEDPGQQVNVIDQHPDVVKSMRAAYETFWSETRPLMVNEAAPMSPVKPFHELFNKQSQTVGIPDWKPPVLTSPRSSDGV